MATEIGADRPTLSMIGGVPTRSPHSTQFRLDVSQNAFLMRNKVWLARFARCVRASRLWCAIYANGAKAVIATDGAAFGA